MQLHIFALVFLLQSFVSGNPTFDHNVKDVVRDIANNAVPRRAAQGDLADLFKRVTTVPNLVPTTTINLSTDSTGTSQNVSPLRIGTVATTTLTGCAGCDKTTTGTHSTGTAGSAQSTSGSGSAGGPHAAPLAGMLLLGLLGL